MDRLEQGLAGTHGTWSEQSPEDVSDQQIDLKKAIAEEQQVTSQATVAAVSAFETNETKSWSWRLGKSEKWGIRLNPVTTIASVIIIWGFIAYCISDPEGADKGLSIAKRWVSDYWTWAYVLSQVIWFVFLAIVYCSKYSNLKLGKDDDEPEFSTASWFFMLFASGVAVGFFYYGVGETVWHYEPCYGSTFAGVDGNCTGDAGNRFSTSEDNVRAQLALNQTLFHWGVHAWVVYALIGLLLGMLCYRQGLPMTMKSCFYPLIGERIYGWLGDLIDVLSVVTTLFGVCTSLGLGVLQLNSGLNLFNPDIPENETTQVITIWVITCIATFSVVSGVHVGIRRLSEITWVAGFFLLMAMFFLGSSFFFLNLSVQSLGWYIFTVTPLSFQCDAFAQLDSAPDGRGAPSTWMDDWTIFYWGWWISWSPFVGMFTAKISKGRTIKEFITGVMTMPVLYSFFWLVVFGGAGLEMEREAARAGVICEHTEFPGGTNETYVEGINQTYTYIDGAKITRLSCLSAERQYFAVWEQFPGYYFFGGLSLGVIILYFVTSSDSGSLVIDCLTANGNPHPPILQRIFWAVTEGAAASALLFAGGKEAVGAVQTASILSGLPYTFILCFLCPALWDVLKQEAGDFNYNRPVFTCHLWDPVTSQGFTPARLASVVKSVFAPFIDAGFAGASMHDSQAARWLEYGVLAVLFYGWVILMCLIPAVSFNIWAIGWCLYIFFVAGLTRLRGTARMVRGMEGDYFTDFIACLVMYPFVATQLAEEVVVNGPLRRKQD